MFPSEAIDDLNIVTGSDKEQLYVVKISSKAFAVGKTLGEINLSDIPSVVITAIKRNNIRVPEPGPETEIKQGDFIVLYGIPQELERAEHIFLQGK